MDRCNYGKQSVKYAWQTSSYSSLPWPDVYRATYVVGTIPNPIGECANMSTAEQSGSVCIAVVRSFQSPSVLCSAHSLSTLAQASDHGTKIVGSSADKEYVLRLSAATYQ
jgi:hypothetical protein